MARAASAIALRGARAQDYAGIIALLAEAGLPADDLRPECVDWFVVARPDGPGADGAVGAGAVQPLGGDGLLRSVVVKGALRGSGLGSRIVGALEASASAQGLAALYLLTADAPGFFEALGYRRIARTDAPAAVRASAQFASICPASAVCMTRALDARALGATGGPARTVR